MHRWLNLRFGPLVIAVFLLGSCSSFFGERSDSVDAEGNPIVQESETSGIDESFTFQDEFQYVRMLDHLDGTFTAIITIPKGSATDVMGSLTAFASCLQGENPSATLEAKPNGGFVYNGSNTAWSGEGKFDPIEDLLLVTGTEDDLREVFSIIDLWFNSGPQIEIQAEVFETRRTESFERGVSELAGADLFADEDGQTFLRAIGGSFPTPTSGGTFEMGMLDSSFQINAALQLLEQEGWVDILSRPRIVTRNGVAASVQNTENIPFLEVAGITANNVTYKVGKSEIGIILNVTPFLVGADTIHLVIDVDVSRIAGEFELGLAGSDAIAAPSTTTRKAQTEVYVRNKESVVIGGMVLTGEKVNESKIPLLGDLPGIGWIFSSREKSEEKTEVFFVIRPILKERPSINRFGDFFDPFDEAGSTE